MADVSKMAEEWLSEHILMQQRKKYGWLVIGNQLITGVTELSKF